jgi:hypothetical protein
LPTQDSESVAVTDESDRQEYAGARAERNQRDGGRAYSLK